MSKNVKIIIVIFIFILICAGGYYYATSGSSVTPTSSIQTTATAGVSANAGTLDAGDAALGDKFLSLLLNMRSIKLDQTLFASPTFTTLHDFSTPISPDANPGRVNPVAPLGQDAVAAPTTVVTTTLPSGVTKSGATFVGSIPPGTVADQRYFEYGTTNVTPLPNVTALVPSSPITGVFTFPITTLAPNTSYYVRAAARINGTVIYGQVVNFKTPAF
jgi:hypothetical protein